MITPACERGSGGSIHRRPFRSRIATTPYERPPSDAREHRSTRTVEGNGSGWLPKFLEPASRFITRLFSAFRSKEKHLVRLDTPMMISTEQRVDGGHISKNSENVGISDLEQLLSQRRFTRFEAKHLMEVINSRFVETHKPESRNSNQAKGSFFQEKRTSSCRSYGAKTFDLSFARKSILSISEAPKVPSVANKISIPRGRSAMYEMARSPFFNCDPSAKMKRGSEYTRNVGGWPSSSQCISRSNLKSYGKQTLKRDASSLDVDNELLGPICKISKKSTEKCYNEELKIKNDSPVDVSHDIDYKNIKESQSIKENKAVDNALFTTVILRSAVIANGTNDATTSAIMANDMNDDATSNGSSRPIIRSTDNEISSDATLPLEKRSYFRMSAPEDLSDQDEDSDATNISEGSFSTLPTQTKSYFHMSVPEDTFSSDEE